MAANCMRKKLEYHRNCSINPKCCLRPNELECPTTFNPPVLGTSVDFCKEALAKAIPIEECILTKPQKLQIATEPIPEDELPTHRHLLNWQKWCRIWKRTQEQLSVARNNSLPPLMTCGEGWSYRKEDTELFERTIHPKHFNGFLIKNTTYPDGLHPGEKDPYIRETLLPRQYRIYPEMKRFRYANRIRKEMGLPDRCPTADDQKTDQYEQGDGVDNEKSGRCFNWEERWRHYTSNLQWMDTCELLKQGYQKPSPANLILHQPGDCDSEPEKRFIIDQKTKQRINVPEFTFSLDENKNQGRTNTPKDQENRYYNEARGPILQVMGHKEDIELSYKASKSDNKYFDSYSSQKFFFDEWEFSATTKGKETRFITMKNEGTTAIRYQWLRFPPNKAMGNMLANPARYLALGGECQAENQNILQPDSSNHSVPKPATLEFRFRELPGVLLPGQSLEFPIVFRCQNTGYYYETLYLLTHPKLNDELGRGYAMRLTGNCADPDLADTNQNEPRSENVAEALTQMTLEQEAADLINSVVDHALFHESNHPCSLPFGKVTTESIFYTHNRNLHYHYGASEKSLEIMRNLIEMLVPQERLNNNEKLCTLSIQSLYQLLWNRNSPRDYYWTHFKSPNAEKLLQTLADNNNIINRPRIFAYPNVQSRQQTACYTTMLSVVDEILIAMDNIDELYSTPELDKIFEDNAEVNVKSGRLSSLNENYINIMDVEAEYAQAHNEDGAEEEEETQQLQASNEGTEEDPGPDGDFGQKRRSSEEEETKRKSTQSGRSEGRTKKKSKTEKESDKNNKQGEKSDDERGNLKKEKKKKLKGDGSQGKAEKVEILRESSPEEVQNAEEEEEEYNTVAHSQVYDEEPEVGTQPPPATPPRVSSGQNVKNEINEEKKLRADQFKRIMFENLFSSGIERMLSVVDAMKSMEDYRTSPYVAKPDDDGFCCSDDYSQD